MTHKRQPFFVPRSLLLALALTTGSAPALAADKDGAYWSQRPDECRNFVRLHAATDRKPETEAVRNWISGYLSAYNRLTPETYDITGATDFEQVLRAVERYCKSNPFADISAAMETVTNDLYPTRHQTRRQAGR